MGWKIQIAPSARTNLRDIVGYIAFHDQEAAQRLGFQLIAQAESLAAFPLKGRVIPEYADERLRKIPCQSYRVNSTNEVVEVIRFWHAARGFPIIRQDTK